MSNGDVADKGEAYFFFSLKFNINLFNGPVQYLKLIYYFRFFLHDYLFNQLEEFFMIHPFNFGWVLLNFSSGELEE